MAEARVTRPKGISKEDWEAWIDQLGALQAANPADPDGTLTAAREAVANRTIELFLHPLAP